MSTVLQRFLENVLINFGNYCRSNRLVKLVQISNFLLRKILLRQYQFYLSLISDINSAIDRSKSQLFLLFYRSLRKYKFACLCRPMFLLNNSVALNFYTFPSKSSFIRNLWNCRMLQVILTPNIFLNKTAVFCSWDAYLTYYYSAF